MPTHTVRRALTGAFIVLCLSPTTARAAGFALFEHGARGMGFAGAYTAQAADPSAIFHNAAGLAFLKGKQIYLGGTVVAPSVEFAGDDPFPGVGVTEDGDAGIAIPPAVYYSQSVGDRAAFGIGVNVPFGLKSAWARPDDFSGRFISQVAELTGFSINPTVAFKLADRLAVGGGVDIRLSSVTLERRVPVFNPFALGQVVDAAQVVLESDTATGIGFNLGLLAKPSESISVGASYRHGVDIDYEGDATFTQLPTGNSQLDQRLAVALPQGALPVTTSIDFPAQGSVGVAWARGDWTVEADVNWYGWSSFERVVLDFEDDELDEVIEEEYDDSMQYRIGIEKSFGTWALRGGYFFDESPAPSASVSPLLPDADRHGIALGGSYVSGHWKVDAASWLVLSPDRSTEGANRDNYNGTYNNGAITFGLSVGYVF